MTGTPARPRPPRLAPPARLRALTGMGVAATVALAVLTAGCLILALGGQKLALAARTDALRSLLAGEAPTAQALQVTSRWNAFSVALAEASAGPSPPPLRLTSDQLTDMTTQFEDDFAISPLRPTGAGSPLPQLPWAGLASDELAVAGLLPALHGLRSQVEIVDRTPLTSFTTLIAGRYPRQAPSSPGAAAAPLEVAVTEQTATRFGLRAGSTFQLGAPDSAAGAPLSVTVTGIVSPRAPGSTFWATDPLASRPTMITPADGPSYWIGAVLASPAEAPRLQQLLGSRLTMTWELPLDLRSVQGDQAQALHDTLSDITDEPPALPGDFGPAASTMQVSSGLIQPVQEFLGTASAVAAVQSLLFASLALTALVVLLLAGSMAALRRGPELTVLRARGASLGQAGWAGLRGALVAGVPAAVVAVAVTLALPGPDPTELPAWWPAVAVLVVALCAPAAAGAWPLRPPRRSSARRAQAGRAHGLRSRRARRVTRVVAEVTVCALAVAALVVLREHGTSAADLFTSAAPALVAIPVVIVEQRLYPLVLRAALRLAARRRGATAFLALAGATRSALTPALPMFALVLALTVASFAGMTRDAITSGEVAASWRAVGADAWIHPGPLQGSGSGAEQAIGGSITPQAIKAIEAVPGVQHVAALYQDLWTTSDGLQVPGVAVDPASYAALAAAEPAYWSPFPAAALARPAAAAAAPVLATPDVAARLGGAASISTTLTRPLRVRVAGLISSTAALPGADSFVVVPLSALSPVSDPIEPNLLLITGPRIDQARLAAAVARTLPTGVVTNRSRELGELTSASLQHGVFVLFAMAIVAASLLGLAVLALALALGAAGRELTLARLATMGLTARQRAWLVALEVGPAVVAAAVAGVACALLLPAAVGPAVDLSPFTGSSVPVPFAADLLSAGLPVAGLAVLAAVALAIEMRAGRRLGVAARMRGQ
ncbi:MAG TPA: hypothetical protein VH478_02425 [Trebonia sp.]|jgi:putative ABC transport system permease protein|nr:hypothetical protein [Trebonia sp.]